MPRSKQDELAYSALRDASGLTREQFELAYRDWFPSIAARPNMGLDQIKQSFSEWARERSFPDAAIAGAVAGYETVARRGFETPDTSSDAQTIKDAEGLMKTDINKYFADKSLVERYGEALARRAENAEQERGVPQPTKSDMHLLNNVQDLLRSDPGRYWSSPDLQSEFRSSIARVIGESDSGPPGPAIDSGEHYEK